MARNMSHQRYLVRAPYRQRDTAAQSQTTGHKEVAVAKGEVRSLWVAVVVPADAATGAYRGTATVAAAGGSPIEVALALTVEGDLLPHGGDDDAMRGTRLHWFDSTLGNEGDTVPGPFTPIDVEQRPDGGGVSTTMRLELFHHSASELLGTIQPLRARGIDR